LLRHAGTPLQSRRVIKPSKNAARAKLAGRSGPVTGLALDDNPEACIDKTSEILSLCHRLEKPTSEIGSWRVESSEYYIRAQNNIVELVAGNAQSRFCIPTFRRSVLCTILLRPMHSPRSLLPHGPRLKHRSNIARPKRRH
jgi:hypothetical protein